MADIERRRELLERLMGRIDEWLGMWLLQSKDAAALRCLRDTIDGALLGDLVDDAAWYELLEMLWQEVVDDDSNE